VKTYELTCDELIGMDDPTLIYHVIDAVIYHDHVKIREWCSEIFGDPNDLRFGGRWQSPHYSMIYFKNSEDRTMFLLRWC